VAYTEADTRAKLIDPQIKSSDWLESYLLTYRDEVIGLLLYTTVSTLRSFIMRKYECYMKVHPISVKGILGCRGSFIDE